jgi:hypothetical protein
MPEITKCKVTMTTYGTVVSESGDVQVTKTEAVDYVRPDFLEAYVADAQARWQHVAVSDEPDAGPAGYHGQTHVPAHLDHPLAGQTFAATQED